MNRLIKGIGILAIIASLGALAACDGDAKKTTSPEYISFIDAPKSKLNNCFALENNVHDGDLFYFGQNYQCAAQSASMQFEFTAAWSGIPMSVLIFRGNETQSVHTMRSGETLALDNGVTITATTSCPNPSDTKTIDSCVYTISSKNATPKSSIELAFDHPMPQINGKIARIVHVTFQ